MKSQKSYLKLGIVLGVFAALVSLMCIAFSYADVNDVNANADNANGQAEAVVGGEEQGEANDANQDYTLSVVLNSKSGKGLGAGIAVTYFDRSDKWINTVKTGADSTAVFTLTSEQLNGKIIAYTPDEYDDGFAYLDESEFKDYSCVKPFQCEASNVSIKADEGLDNFNLHMQAINLKPQEQNYVVNSFKSTLAFLPKQIPDVVCTAKVNEDGVISIVCNSPTIVKGDVAKYDFAPNFKDGYTFDYVEADGKKVEVDTTVDIDPSQGIKAVLHSKSDTPVVPTSAELTGKVVRGDADFTPVSGAIVKFANEETGEVFATATTGDDGSYIMSNIDVNIVKKIIDGTIEEPVVYATYPKCDFDTSYPYSASWSIEGDKYVCEADEIVLDDADVYIYGQDHHKGFIVRLDAVYISAEGQTTSTMIYDFSSIGLLNGYTVPVGGLDFTIGDDGIFRGHTEMNNANDSRSIDYTITPVCDEGYVFDYANVNGDIYRCGSTVSFDGENLYEASVNYKEATGGLAQTGDAIPYAVVVGLGLVAIAAFVIARKQFN